VSYAIGVIAFSVALLLSVMLHEAGHFVTAKYFGMKASRFFVGFGPTLWSFRRGETEYGVKAIPAGGFVKIEGMTALEELSPQDEPRAFYKQPAGQRTVVLVAGSFVHFLIAILLMFGILAATGEDPLRTDGIQIGQVTECLTADPTGVCRAGDPAAPAFGKLQVGDVLRTVDGKPVGTQGRALINVLHASSGKPVTVGFVRDGQARSVTLTPKPLVVAHHKVQGRIGISTELHPAHVSVAGAVPRTFTVLGSFVKSTGSAIGGLPHEIAGIFHGDSRDPNGAASVVDVARVSGQISSSGASTGAIVASLLLLIAELNLFVGIFNLLPLLPLDGGHVAILAFEQARSRVYRLIGRRDPGRVDIMKVLPLTYAVVAAFVGLSLILLYAGIANPIRLQ
jgi:membrane-associated protease RseP (regulator of RpoE activity)